MSVVEPLPPELEAFEPPGHVRALLAALQQRGHAAYLVGGSVRDLLLGRPVHEFDVASDARPEEVQSIFPHAIPTGIAHGTVTVVIDGVPMEVTTFRGEASYVDGRRPSGVSFHRNLHEDLARRDLTINAMAFDPVTHHFEDRFGGRDDLANKLVRAVGEPSVRFNEDGLRVMRAVRFASVLGFRLERSTRRAIPGALETFDKVAVERIRVELEKLLLGEHPRYGIELLRRTGILARILPELLEGLGMRQNRWHRYDVYHHTLRTLDASPPVLEVRLAALLHDIDKPRTAAPSPKGAAGELSFYNHEHSGALRAQAICARLRFPTKVCQRVTLLVKEHQFVYTAEWSDAAVRRMIARVGAENLPALLALREADMRGRGREIEAGLAEVTQLRARIEAVERARPPLELKDLAIRGDEVMAALGVGPSPIVGEAMRHLLGLVLEHPEQNNREELLAALASFRVT